MIGKGPSTSSRFESTCLSVSLCAAAGGMRRPDLTPRSIRPLHSPQLALVQPSSSQANHSRSSHPCRPHPKVFHSSPSFSSPSCHRCHPSRELNLLGTSSSPSFHSHSHSSQRPNQHRIAHPYTRSFFLLGRLGLVLGDPFVNLTLGISLGSPPAGSRRGRGSSARGNQGSLGCGRRHGGRSQAQGECRRGRRRG